ncbi:MAG: DUF115 domain-containing protein [Treponema sp.]|nr:DUF115 domain-containing protein [Treponema sp.]
MSFIEKNKKILLDMYPGLWEELSSGDETLLEDNKIKDIKIETTQTGDPTLCINGIYIHSPRDPLREGQRLVQAANFENGYVVILGFGLGYTALAAAGLGLPIIIIEKYKSILLKALELRDFCDFLSNNKLIFVVGGFGEGVTDALAIANELISSKNDEEPKSGDKKNIGQLSFVIRNKALISLDEIWYKSAEDKIRTWTMRDDVNAATHKRFGQRWVRNLSRNMSAIRDLPGVSHLAGFVSNDSIPVFLAAAGPSLDKIKPLLPDIQKRCIIVAVDTSFRFFVKNGIQPDFVLVVDPQFWNSRHLDRCFNDKIGEKTTEKTALIAESAVYPPVLNLPFKNKFLCGSLFPLGTFIEKQVDPKGRLGAGGSVATTAWDFARLLGAKDIWIAGLDLAYPDLKTHFKGARFEERSNSESSRFNPVEKWVVRLLRDGFSFKAKSGTGVQVLTDRRLSLYAAWFENQFKQNTDIKNYALFQEGLAISGLHSADMQDFLALPCRREEIDSLIQNSRQKIDKVFNEQQKKKERAARYESAVSSLKQGLDKIKTAAEEGVEIARRALRYPLNEQQQSKVLRELDGVLKSVTESDVKEVAGFLFPQMDEENIIKENGENDQFRSYLKTLLKFLDGVSQAVKFDKIR